MAEQRRLVLVNYLNTLPFLHGLKESLPYGMELIQAHPADCAETFLTGRANIGLIPVGALIGQNNWTRISDYGIGCDGPVATVCLFGHTPIHEWDQVVLDYQSRTSVLLARILLTEYWQCNPGFEEAKPGFELHIAGRTGGLIIGDRAIQAKDIFPYSYDLGEAWKALTGLPFVFATWVTRGQKDPGMENWMNQAFRSGLQAIPDIVRAEQERYHSFDLEHYYQQNIRYVMDEPALDGLQEFLKKAVTTG